MRCLGGQWLLIWLSLALLGGCSATTKSTSCPDGGSKRSNSGISYCEYEIGRFGVQESTFACPSGFPVLHSVRTLRFCFRSEAERTQFTGQTSNSDVVSPGDMTAPGDVEPDQGVDSGPIRTPVNGQCIRSVNDECTIDDDCRTGGCGGELCYNPQLSSGGTTCDCEAPTSIACGCVNGRCTWYQ